MGDQLQLESPENAGRGRGHEDSNVSGHSAARKIEKKVSWPHGLHMHQREPNEDELDETTGALNGGSSYVNFNEKESQMIQLEYNTKESAPNDVFEHNNSDDFANRQSDNVTRDQ